MTAPPEKPPAPERIYLMDGIARDLRKIKIVQVDLERLDATDVEYIRADMVQTYVDQVKWERELEKGTPLSPFL